MKKVTGHKSVVQQKNIAWFLPRPKKDRYKGGMPLYAEEWLIDVAKEILDENSPFILNVFCGMNTLGVRVDIKPEVKPDILCDVHELSKCMFASNQFDVIFSDPPYSTEEARDIYGTPPLKYKKWTAECDKFLRPGGLFIVYHKYVMPNPDPTKYEVVKRVFIGNRTYHLPRVAIFFRKK